MVMIILLAILLSMFLYLLFAPIAFIIDSRIGLVQIRLFRIISAQPVIIENDIVLLIIVLGMRFRINITKIVLKQSSTKRKTQTQEKQVNKVQDKDSRRISLAKMRNMFHSFKFKEFRLHIDTGNYPLNGQLYPLFYWLSRWTGKEFTINFDNKNILVLYVENSLGRMLSAYLKPINM